MANAATTTASPQGGISSRTLWVGGVLSVVVLSLLGLFFAPNHVAAVRPADNSPATKQETPDVAKAAKPAKELPSTTDVARTENAKAATAPSVTPGTEAGTSAGPESQAGRSPTDTNVAPASTATVATIATSTSEQAASVGRTIVSVVAGGNGVSQFAVQYPLKKAVSRKEKFGGSIVVDATCRQSQTAPDTEADCRFVFAVPASTKPQSLHFPLADISPLAAKVHGTAEIELRVTKAATPPASGTSAKTAKTE